MYDPNTLTLFGWVQVLKAAAKKCICVNSPTIIVHFAPKVLKVFFKVNLFTSLVSLWDTLL